MIKRYCDICKREIDKFADEVRPFYHTRSFDCNLCEDCKEKWTAFKRELQEKYEKQYDELAKAEQKEICDFLGINEEDFHKDYRMEEIE